MDFSLLFNGQHWFDPNPGAPSLAYLVLAFVFAAVLGASAYYYFNKGRLFSDNRLMYRLIGQMSTIGLIIGGLGLALVILRYLAVPYLSAPGLIFLTVIALIGAIAYYMYYFVRVFPSKMVAYRVEAERRKYMPKPAAQSSRSSKKKSKRRR